MKRSYIYQYGLQYKLNRGRSYIFAITATDATLSLQRSSIFQFRHRYLFNQILVIQNIFDLLVSSLIREVVIKEQARFQVYRQFTLVCPGLEDQKFIFS